VRGLTRTLLIFGVAVKMGLVIVMSFSSSN
jgi:type IV secretory pathway VirB3-like protein